MEASRYFERRAGRALNVICNSEAEARALETADAERRAVVADLEDETTKKANSVRRADSASARQSTTSTKFRSWRAKMSEPESPETGTARSESVSYTGATPTVAEKSSYYGTYIRRSP